MTTPMVAGPTLVTIQGSAANQVVCPPVGGPVLVYNADLLNVAYVGYQPNLTPTNASAVQPLGYTVLDGTRQLYGACPAGNATLNVTPGGISQSASPAQIAAQINALGLMKDSTGQTGNVNTSNVHTDISLGTNQFLSGASGGAIASAGSTVAKDIVTNGAPLIAKKTGVTSAGSTILTAGTPLTLGPFTLHQIAYETTIQLSTASAATSPLLIEMIFTDSAGGGAQTDYVAVEVYASTTSVPTHAIMGRGPSRGDQVTIKFTALINNINVVYAFFESSRPFTDHFWRSQWSFTTPPVFPNMTTAPSNPNAGVICQYQASIAASGSSGIVLLPLYTGKVFMDGRTSDGTAANGEFRLNNNIDAYVGPISWIAKCGQTGFDPGLSGVIQSGGFPLPFAQTQMQANNLNTTTAETLDFNIYGMEYK